MSWDNYDKSVQEALKENPYIRDAVRNMRENGHSKEYAQRVSGAPYEIVDSIYNDGKKRRDKDRDPDGNV